MRQALHELKIRTRGRGLYEFTKEAAAWLLEQRFRDGLLTVHLLHTSASLLIHENADPEVRRDLEAFFAQLVPDRVSTSGNINACLIPARWSSTSSASKEAVID